MLSTALVDGPRSGGPRFPLPSEIADAPGAEDWRSMYPYFTRFQPEDDQRFWFQASGSSSRGPAVDDLDLLARLRDARGLVFDLDGTLVLGDRQNHGLRPLPGAVEITSWAAGRGLPFVVFTNGTTRTPARLAGIMREIGFGLADEAMMTPASSAVRVLGRQGHRRIMVLGGPGLTEPLEEAGFEVVPPAAGTAADAVLAGWFAEFTMPALEAACHAVWDGAELYSCSETPFFAVDGGRARRPHLQVRGVDELLVILTGEEGM